MVPSAMVTGYAQCGPMTIRSTKIDLLSLTAVAFFVAYLAVAFIGVGTP
jgi:hypothetical protein